MYGDKQGRKLVIAIVLLLAAITAVLVRDREVWFGNDNDEPVVADNNQTAAAAPGTAEPALPAPTADVKAPTVDKQTVAATSSQTSTNHTHRSVHHAKSSANRDSSRDLKSTGAKSSATWGPATTAAQRAQSSEQAQAHPQPAPYPLLTEATAVKGSVLLQALISADGTVEDLRVISGPTILVSAARQAVQQWRFKPYMLNGKPVETYARVTVNFTIDVSNTEARLHLNSVTSSGAL